MVHYRNIRPICINMPGLDQTISLGLYIGIGLDIHLAIYPKRSWSSSKLLAHKTKIQDIGILGYWPMCYCQFEGPGINPWACE